MGINSNVINMKSADLIPSEWHEKFITFLKKEDELLETSLDDEEIESMEMEYDDYYDYEEDDSEDNDDDDDKEDTDNDYEIDTDDDITDVNDDDDDDKDEKQEKAQCYLRMIRISPLFASQPRLERICKDWKNNVLSKRFRKYTFRSNKNDSVNEIHEKTNDIKYLINLCGSHLTNLDLSTYPTSQLMPIINANCPSLKSVALGFKEISSQDFENCFSKMPNLQMLSIDWECKNSTLPMTLAKSIKQIGRALISLKLSCTLKGNDMFSPDTLVSVFPRLTALRHLEIWKFGLSQLLIQSISKAKNVFDLELTSRWPKNHPMFDTKINMYPIGNMKKLWYLRIDCNYGVRDEFLINLCNNAKKLALLTITGTNISDTGMSAIDNLKNLDSFNFGLTSSFYVPRTAKNEFITDESIQCLFNQELGTLNISNCINITDKSVLKLVENLPNLRSLYIKNTKVTRQAVEEIYKLTKQRKKLVKVHHSFKNND